MTESNRLRSEYSIYNIDKFSILLKIDRDVDSSIRLYPLLFVTFFVYLIIMSSFQFYHKRSVSCLCNSWNNGHYALFVPPTRSSVWFTVITSVLESVKQRNCYRCFYSRCSFSSNGDNQDNATIIFEMSNVRDFL